MRAHVVLTGLLGAAIPVLALAAEPAKEASVDQAQEEVEEAATTVRDELVVSASLEPVERGVLPFSVDVITRQDIARRQATGVADLLATVPGLQVARSGSPGKVTSLFTRGTESDHTLVLWNGVELNNPFFGGFDWAFLPTDGVERVEVARGPLSAIHGGEAVGGVVQIFSGGSGESGSTYRFEGGGNGYLRGSVATHLETGRARFNLAAHVRRGDGESPNDFFDSEELLFDTRFDLAGGRTLGLFARANDSEIGIPFAGGTPSPLRQSSWSERQIAVPFRAKLESWDLESQISWVGLESRFSDPEDVFGFTSSATASEALRLRAAATRLLAAGGWIGFGGEAERLEVDDRSVFGVNLLGARQETRSLFAEVYRPAGRARVDLGLRYDDNDVFGSRLSPRLGIGVELGVATVSASYGEAFRAPSLGELFFPFSGNSMLEPEESQSFEVGLERRHGAWRWAFALFENRLENLIDFDFRTFTNVNIGRAETRGGELSVGWESADVEVRWNATWLESEDKTTGLPLLRRAGETSTLTVATSPGPSFGLHLTGRYVGDRDDVDPISFARAQNGSFVVFDLAGEWRRPGRWKPYARLENLADRDYEEVLGFAAPGRRLVGGVEISGRAR